MPLTTAGRKFIVDRANNSVGTFYAALFRDNSTNAYTFTVTNPTTVTATGHNFINGVRVKASTTGTLPTGLDTTAVYRVIGVSGNTFNLCTEANYSKSTKTGTAINTLAGGSGTHTLTEQALGEDDAMDVWARWESVYNGSARQSASIGAATDTNPAIAPLASFNFTPTTGAPPQIAHRFWGVIVNGSPTTGNSAGTLKYFEDLTTTQTITAAGKVYTYQAQV
jgi:hypothetical protein